MKLKGFTQEQIMQLSMIELAYELLASNNKQAIHFKDLVAEISKLLELSEDEVRARMPQFYTDLNIDGRFLSVGENRWGMRSWYPYDQIEEEVVPVAKPKKKRAKKKAEEEDDIEEVEDFDELDDEDYDDLDDLDELDDLDDDEDDEEVLIDEKDVDDDDETEDEEFDDELLDDDYDLDDDEDDEVDEIEEIDEEDDDDK